MVKLNSLVYRTPFSVIIYRSHEF